MVFIEIMKHILYQNIHQDCITSPSRHRGLGTQVRLQHAYGTGKTEFDSYLFQTGKIENKALIY